MASVDYLGRIQLV